MPKSAFLLPDFNPKPSSLYAQSFSKIIQVPQQENPATIILWRLVLADYQAKGTLASRVSYSDRLRDIVSCRVSATPCCSSRSSFCIIRYNCCYC